MKNHRFPWLRNRTTDNRKCEKARNIKEKRTIEMFSTASKPPVARLSSPSAKKVLFSPENFGFPGFSSAFCCKALTYQNLSGQNSGIIDHNILRFVVKFTTILVVTI